MREEQDEIVVLRYFDTAIDANIAKSKLDAHGIPCFLTEENMSNLYGANAFLGFRVRLHLFARDEQRAREVLSDIDLLSDSDTKVQCPKCRSPRIDRTFPKRAAESLAVMFFGVLMPHKKVNHCLDCEHEF